MREEVDNSFTFRYKDYDTMLSDIPSLQELGFIIIYGELENNEDYNYILVAKKINDLIIRNRVYSDTYIIYGEDYVVLREGINDIQQIYRDSLKNNLSKLSKQQTKEFCINQEHEINKRDITAQSLDKEQTMDLINLILDTGSVDSEYLKELANHLKELK